MEGKRPKPARQEKVEGKCLKPLLHLLSPTKKTKVTVVAAETYDGLGSQRDEAPTRNHAKERHTEKSVPNQKTQRTGATLTSDELSGCFGQTARQPSGCLFASYTFAGGTQGLGL